MKAMIEKEKIEKEKHRKRSKACVGINSSRRSVVEVVGDVFASGQMKKSRCATSALLWS